MPELTELDVENYTEGRLSRDADETTRWLNTGLGAARRYCGWPVTPVHADDVVTLDGPGTRLLALPTLALGELKEVVEDGVTLDLAGLDVSPRGLVCKKSGALWSARLGAITVKMTHGYTDAPDWQSAVLSFIDRMSLEAGGNGAPRVIGPFQYDTAPRAAVASAFSDAERMLLDLYRLEAAP